MRRRIVKTPFRNRLVNGHCARQYERCLRVKSPSVRQAIFNRAHLLHRANDDDLLPMIDVIRTRKRVAMARRRRIPIPTWWLMKAGLITRIG